MEIFEFNDHLKIVHNWIQTQPRNGYGLAKEIANELRISSTLMSQILSGQREISLDHAYRLTTKMGLTNVEKKYFMLLVHRSKAGFKDLRDHYDQEISDLIAESEKVRSRTPKNHEMNSAVMAQFYSDWIYSVVRLLTSIEKFQTLDSLSERTKTPREKVAQILDFLVENGLVIKQSDRYLMGPSNTHLNPNSPYFFNRQLQWRLKAIENMKTNQSDAIFFTAPFTVSTSDYGKLRKELLDLIQRFSKTVKDSPAQELACLNFDFFKL